MLVTTTPTIEGGRITRYYGIVSGETIIGANVFRDFFASIRDVVPNDLSEILETADIQTIYTNGGKAYELYCKYIYPVNGIKAHKLPSTSPANAGYSLDRLKEAWAEIKE